MKYDYCWSLWSCYSDVSGIYKWLSVNPTSLSRLTQILNALKSSKGIGEFSLSAVFFVFSKNSCWKQLLWFLNFLMWMWRCSHPKTLQSQGPAGYTFCHWQRGWGSNLTNDDVPKNWSWLSTPWLQRNLWKLWMWYNHVRDLWMFISNATQGFTGKQPYLHAALLLGFALPLECDHVNCRYQPLNSKKSNVYQAKKVNFELSRQINTRELYMWYIYTGLWIHWEFG